VALGPFTALKGFRPADEIAKSLFELGGSALAREIGELAEGRASGLRDLFTALLSLGPEARTTLLTRAAQVGVTHDALEWEWVHLLTRKYPGDVGALSPLLLNLVELAPGEGMFLGPGEMHAYLEGTGIELMANSDNVLRGGLTPKHVDLPELLAVGRFEPAPPGVMRGELVSSRERLYPTPAPEFELALVDVSPEEPFAAAPGQGVQLLLGLEGEMTAESGSTRVPLGRGESAFVPAALAGYTVKGQGRVARASVPGAGPR
jgi:mannose-6-phosphate isomerase